MNDESRCAHIITIGFKYAVNCMTLHEIEEVCDFRVASRSLEWRDVIANGLVQAFFDGEQLSKLIRQIGFEQYTDRTWAG